MVGQRPIRIHPVSRVSTFSAKFVPGRLDVTPGGVSSSRARLGTPYSFPIPSPAPAPGSNFIEGLIPAETGPSIKMVLAGLGVAAVSTILPGQAKPIALWGGMGLAALGVYGVVSANTSDPKFERSTVPPNQKTDQIEARIVEPSQGGKAHLSGMWARLFGVENTFKFSVIFENKSKTPISFQAQIRVTETPTYGDTVQTNTPFLISLNSDEVQTLDGKLPIKTTLLGGIDMKIEVYIKGSASDVGRVAATSKFTA